MLKKIALILLLIAPMTVFAQKFGHIKTQAIISIMPEYTKAQTDIQTLQKQYEDDIKRLTDELQKKFTEYQQEQANLPKNIQVLVERLVEQAYLFHSILAIPFGVFLECFLAS